jgi:hypothetical protein
MLCIYSHRALAAVIGGKGVPDDMAMRMVEDPVARKFSSFASYVATELDHAELINCETPCVWTVSEDCFVGYTPDLTTFKDELCVLHDWKTGAGPTAAQLESVNAFIKGGCAGQYPDSAFARDVFQVNAYRCAYADEDVTIDVMKLVYGGSDKSCNSVLEVLVPHLPEEFVYRKVADHVQDAAVVRKGKKNSAVYYAGRVLLAAVWAPSPDLFHRFCETLSMDTTFKACRARHPLISIVGMDGNGKNFVALEGIIPNQQLGTFQWVLTEAAPELLGRKSLAAVTQMIIDENPQEYNAIMFAKNSGVLPNVRIRHCQWHLVNQVHAKQCLVLVSTYSFLT